MTNKQRITKLTAAEKRAAVTGGWLDLEIPLEVLRQRLEIDPKNFDIDAVLSELAREVAFIRVALSADSMQPNEICQQAAATIEVIDELFSRLDHMHPDLKALVDESLYRNRSSAVPALDERVRLDLDRYRTVLRLAASKLENQPGQRGPKQYWTVLKRSVANILSENCKSKISKHEAQSLGAELLEICEVRLRKQRQ